MTFKIKSYETFILLCEYEIWSVTLKRQPYMVYESTG